MQKDTRKILARIFNKLRNLDDDGGGSEGDGDDDSDGEGDCMSAPIKGINLTGGIHSKMPPIWLQFKIKLCQLSRI